MAPRIAEEGGVMQRILDLIYGPCVVAAAAGFAAIMLRLVEV